MADNINRAQRLAEGFAERLAGIGKMPEAREDGRNRAGTERSAVTGKPTDVQAMAQAFAQRLANGSAPPKPQGRDTPEATLPLAQPKGATPAKPGTPPFTRDDNNALRAKPESAKPNEATLGKPKR